MHNNENDKKMECLRIEDHLYLLRSVLEGQVCRDEK